MQENVVTMTADTPNLSRAGAAPHSGTSLEPAVSLEAPRVDLVATTNAGEQPTAAAPSNVPNSTGEPATAEVNVSECPVAKPILLLTGGTEVLRVSKEFNGLKQPLIEVEAGSENSLEEILERSKPIHVAFRGTSRAEAQPTCGWRQRQFSTQTGPAGAARPCQ